MDGFVELDQRQITPVSGVEERRAEAQPMGVTAVVLGMHRSGTSCLAQILKACGVHFGDADLPASATNMEGHVESPEALIVNELILARSGGAWDRVPPELRLDPDVFERMKAFVAGLRQTGSVSAATSEECRVGQANRGPAGLRFAATRLAGPEGAEPRLIGLRGPSESLSDLDPPGGCTAAPVWGWKDPRTVLTFPLWKPLLAPYRIVACFRHPAGVAKSLAVRDDMALDKGYALWAAYAERLLEHVRDEPRVLWFDFDRTPEAIDAWLDHVCRELTLRRTPEAVAIFNKFERHHHGEQSPLPPRLCELYEELVRRAQEAASACRQPLSLSAAAVERQADAAWEGLRGDLAALADVQAKHNAFLQTHDRELRELKKADETGVRADARAQLALARIDELERNLEAEAVRLRAKLAECDRLFQSILNSRAWRWYRRLQRTGARLRQAQAAVWKTTIALCRRAARFGARAATRLFE
jgi:hypothetical protein